MSRPSINNLPGENLIRRRILLTRQKAVFAQSIMHRIRKPDPFADAYYNVGPFCRFVCITIHIVVSRACYVYGLDIGAKGGGGRGCNFGDIVRRRTGNLK